MNDAKKKIKKDFNIEQSETTLVNSSFNTKLENLSNQIFKVSCIVTILFTIFVIVNFIIEIGGINSYIHLGITHIIKNLIETLLCSIMIFIGSPYIVSIIINNDFAQKK